MPIRPPGLLTSRPDNSTGIVGERGIPVKQDIDGTQIQRLGIAGADADWGPNTVTLAANGDVNDNDEVKIAEPDGVGGTTSSGGIIRSLDSANCSVAYVWTDGVQEYDTLQEYRNCPKCIVQEPAAIQDDVENVIQNVTTKSDNAVVFVTNEAGSENQVQYTLNFH